MSLNWDLLNNWIGFGSFIVSLGALTHSIFVKKEIRENVNLNTIRINKNSINGDILFIETLIEINEFENNLKIIKLKFSKIEGRNLNYPKELKKKIKKISKILKQEKIDINDFSKEITSLKTIIEGV